MAGSKGRRTHGEASKTPEYKTWQVMRQRCYNPRDEHYKNYGARGIDVCDRWLNSYENFLEDMGRRPSRRYSIDRKDVNAGYAPGNCRWASPTDQQNNRRNNRKYSFDGKLQTLSAWSRDLNINRRTLFSRINEMGWPVHVALSTPARSR